MNIKSALLSAAMAAVSVNCFADTPAPDRHVQQFLDALNGGGESPSNNYLPRPHVRC